MTIALIAGLSAIVLLGAGSCDSQPTSQQAETDRQQSNYDRQVAAEPARAMDYPMTRKTINFWIDTWNEPGKLAYVYLMASNGQMIGYYVFQGLPVSYCASLTPTYRIHADSSQGRVVVPAPAMDGVYYSGGGGLCSTYYGQDAVSGAYLEYTAGTGISALVYSEPLARQDVEPLGVATIETVGS